MLAGLGAIIYKEMIQVRRDPATRIIFVIPVIQLIVFGYALDLEVRDVATVVFDADRRSASRELIHRFESTDVFRIKEEARDPAAVREAIVAGRAKVGIIIPARFSDDLVTGRNPQVQVLIDGSDNTVASQALAAANGIALSMAPGQRVGSASADAARLPSTCGPRCCSTRTCSARISSCLAWWASSCN